MYPLFPCVNYHRKISYTTSEGSPFLSVYMDGTFLCMRSSSRIGVLLGTMNVNLSDYLNTSATTFAFSGSNSANNVQTNTIWWDPNAPVPMNGHTWFIQPYTNENFVSVACPDINYNSGFQEGESEGTHPIFQECILINDVGFTCRIYVSHNRRKCTRLLDAACSRNCIYIPRYIHAPKINML